MKVLENDFVFDDEDSEDSGDEKKSEELTLEELDDIDIDPSWRPKEKTPEKRRRIDISNKILTDEDFVKELKNRDLKKKKRKKKGKKKKKRKREKNKK